jgi:hypothetical protein
MWAAGVLELGKPRKKVGGLRASGYVRRRLGAFFSPFLVSSYGLSAVYGLLTESRI